MLRLKSCSGRFISRSLSYSFASWNGELAKEKVSQSSSETKPFSSLPGPAPLPLLGNTRELMANSKCFLSSYVYECFKKYGDIFKLSAVGRDMVFIKDPSTIEEILRTEGKYPERDLNHGFAWLYRNRLHHEPPSGSCNGQAWKKLRTAIGKQAIPRNVQSYSAGFNAIYERFMRHIRESLRNKEGVVDDVTLPIKMLLMEISAKFVFDNDLNVVCNPSKEDYEFIEGVSDLIHIFSRVYSELPFYKVYHNQLSRDFLRSFEATRNRTLKEMRNLYSRLEAGEESEAPGMLELWLREGKLTEEEIILEAGQIFVAGVDTTANQSVFLLHHIATYPEVQQKLYEEVKSVLCDSKQATPEQLSQMTYLKGCMLESLRLQSTAPGFIRIIAEDASLLGYSVPAGTAVLYSLYSAGRDEKLFPDPLKFDPERWKRDDKHAFAILPFGHGPRACYGRRFAELEMKLFMAQVISNFEVSTELEEMKVTEMAVLKPDGHVPIKFIDRN